jgi:ubiquinone/menaquinone biosynthesis C-methylase UbiE
MTVDIDSESQRIIDLYDRRERETPPDYYALYHLRNLFIHQEHERMFVRCLQQAGQVPLTQRRVLEVGCGTGNWLCFFESLGTPRQNLAGIELGTERVEFASRRLPGADIRTGDAAKLSWPDGSFDVVYQRMMFSSILDPDVRKVAAGEIMRVTRPGGAILWVDFFVNPRNAQVCCLSRRDIAALFPGWRARLYRATLAPPISRRLSPVAWSLARALEKLKIFNTFYFGFLKRGR